MTKLKSLIPLLITGVISLNSCEPQSVNIENTPFLPPVRSQIQEFHLNTPVEFEDSCVFGTISVDLLPSLEGANKKCIVAALPTFPTRVYINDYNQNLNVNVCYLDKDGIHCVQLEPGNYFNGVSIQGNPDARIFAISYGNSENNLEINALESVMPQLLEGLVDPYIFLQRPAESVSTKES